MKTFLRLFSWTTLLCCAACGEADDKTAKPASTPKPIVNPSNEPLTNVAKAGSITLGGGCFWCLEAVFELVEGVSRVKSGYVGGAAPNPTYEQVCSGTTGHVEIVQVEYDPGVISFGDLLEIFFVVHDPTTLNRQGNDVGTQYRSGIYVYGEAQRAEAEAARTAFAAKLRDAGFGSITTEVLDAPPFYFAEDYHQQYLDKNPNGYCGLGGTGVTCPVGVI